MPSIANEQGSYVISGSNWHESWHNDAPMQFSHGHGASMSIADACLSESRLHSNL